MHFYFRYTMLGAAMGIPGKMRCDEAGDCFLSMYIEGEYTEESTSPLKIVAYDKDNYAVMYSCMEMVEDMAGFTWFAILQKQNPLPIDKVSEAYEAVQAAL